jgi:hypothetical protein
MPRQTVTTLAPATATAPVSAPAEPFDALRALDRLRGANLARATQELSPKSLWPA